MEYNKNKHDIKTFSYFDRDEYKKLVGLKKELYNDGLINISQSILIRIAFDEFLEVNSYNEIKSKMLEKGRISLKKVTY